MLKRLKSDDMDKSESKQSVEVETSEGIQWLPLSFDVSERDWRRCGL